MTSTMTDQYLANNQGYADGQALHKPSYPGVQPIQPAKRVAVVACMGCGVSHRSNVSLRR